MNEMEKERVKIKETELAIERVKEEIAECLEKIKATTLAKIFAANPKVNDSFQGFYKEYFLFHLDSLDGTLPAMQIEMEDANIQVIFNSDATASFDFYKGNKVIGTLKYSEYDVEGSIEGFYIEYPENICFVETEYFNHLDTFIDCAAKMLAQFDEVLNQLASSLEDVLKKMMKELRNEIIATSKMISELES